MAAILNPGALLSVSTALLKVATSARNYGTSGTVRIKGLETAPAMAVAYTGTHGWGTFISQATRAFDMLPTGLGRSEYGTRAYGVARAAPLKSSTGVDAVANVQQFYWK